MKDTLSLSQELRIIWTLIHRHGWRFKPEQRLLYNPLAPEWLTIPEDRVAILLLLTNTNLN